MSPAGATCAQIGEQRAVTVPATSANLGPGFDSFGLAVSIRNRVAVTVEQWRDVTGEDAGPDARADLAVLVAGEGAESLSGAPDNLVVTSFIHGLQLLAASGDLAQWPERAIVDCHNAVPLSRGLGSSSAALVAGLAAAFAVAGMPADDASRLRIARIAAELEGHPDNVVPAAIGGVTVSWQGTHGDPGTLRFVRRELHPALTPIPLVPPNGLSTAKARSALPAEIPLRDAAANGARVGILLAALTEEPELLLDATEDRLHQQYRRSEYADSIDLMLTLRGRGVPAAISGAGPTVLAWQIGDSPVDVALPDGWSRAECAGESAGIRWS